MLSIILLSYYSSTRIVQVYRSVSKLLKENNIPFEFIIIDDGSKDDSFDIAKALEGSESNVSAFQLSKNYTSHYAIFAGLSVCKGECAMPLPDDEQQPYNTIVDMYRLWQNGEKIIVPYREKRNDGMITNALAKIFYNTINLTSNIRFPKGGADLFFIDREIIDIINSRIHPINTSSIIEVLKLGFNPHFYPFKRVKSVNAKSRWTFRKKLRLFKDTFFSCSTWPIRMITTLGLTFSIFAFFIILFYSGIAIWGVEEFWGKKLPGWTSTVVIISFFSGLILLALGIIAEYIWRIYEEVKQRPGYIIKKHDLDKHDK